MVTRDVFHAYLTQNVDRVVAIERYPHEPLIPGHYYMHPALPPSTGKAFRKVLGSFNPSTNVDYDLVKACFMTMASGISPGSRPAWLFTGKAGDPRRGRGIGKTTVPQMVARLFGGYIRLNTKDNFSDLLTRLLSADGLLKRVVLLDNIKTLRLSWEELESFITSDTISGRRLYHGEGSRPNTLNVCLTVNGASVSTDIAQRCIVVELDRPTYSATWEQDLEAFIDSHRWEIIADIIAELRKEPLPLPSFTRWGQWESAVLARATEEPEETLRVLAERRATIDDDDAEADLVRSRFVRFLEHRRHDPKRETIFIPSEVAGKLVIEARGIQMELNSACRHLSTLGIKEVSSEKFRGQRGVFWRGQESPTPCKVSPL